MGDRICKGQVDAVGITIVIKTGVEQCATSDVVSKLEELLTGWSGTLHDFRSDAFNVRVASPGLALGIREHRLIHVLMPVPPEETLRVRSRARHASLQLRSLNDCAQSGLLALGLSDRHDGSLVFGILERAMQSGRYRGIAATLLLKSGMHLDRPQRTIVDLAEIRFNPKATAPLASEFHLRSLGPIAAMTKAEPRYLDVPAYRCLFASGKPAGQAGGFLGLNDVPRIPKELLA